MSVREQDWVTLEEAAETVKISVTTLRAWYRQGAVESTSSAEGRRLVRLCQVQERAAGLIIDKSSALGNRLGRKNKNKLASETAADLELAVSELQSLARERLE